MNAIWYNEMHKKPKWKQIKRRHHMKKVSIGWYPHQAFGPNKVCHLEKWIRCNLSLWVGLRGSWLCSELSLFFWAFLDLFCYLLLVVFSSDPSDLFRLLSLFVHLIVSYCIHMKIQKDALSYKLYCFCLLKLMKLCLLPSWALVF